MHKKYHKSKSKKKLGIYILLQICLPLEHLSINSIILFLLLLLQRINCSVLIFLFCVPFPYPFLIFPHQRISCCVLTIKNFPFLLLSLQCVSCSVLTESINNPIFTVHSSKLFLCFILFVYFDTLRVFDFAVEYME